jgi:hypothetical protein
VGRGRSGIGRAAASIACPALVIRSALLTPAAVALLAMAALAGCGSSSIDSDELEEKLRTDLSAELSVFVGANPDDVSIDCPDDIPAEEGEEFECTASAPKEGELLVEVTLTDDEGGFEAVVPPKQFGTPPGE